MKIAYFLDVVDYLGGAANVLIQQAYIMKKICDVLIVIPCDEQGNINEEFIKRCLLLELNHAVLPFTTAFCMKDTDIIDVEQNIAEMKSFIRENNFDLLHSVQLNPTVELASRELKIPHLMNIYSIDPSEFLIKYYDVYPKYQSSDSELYSKVWQEGLGCISRCIRPSVNLRETSKTSKNRSSIYIGMAGSIIPEKNQLMAIKLLEKCLAKNWDLKLIIAGYDIYPYALSCKEYIKENNLEANIEIIGFTDNIEKDLLRKIDVFLCTSRRESFPSSIVEAMTKGIPIIAVPISGIPELLINGENAYISKDNSIDALLVSVNDYLLDCESGKINEIIKNAEITYHNHFSPEVIRKQLSDYYDFIIRNNNECKQKRQVISINDLSAFIQPIHKKISANQESFSDLSKIYKRVWYYSHLNEILTAKQAYIWGAGKLGKQALEIIATFWEQIDITHFIDGQKSGIYCDIEIINRDQIDFEKDCYIFIAFEFGQEQAIDWLAKKGIKLNENIFILP